MKTPESLLLLLLGLILIFPVLLWSDYFKVIIFVSIPALGIGIAVGYYVNGYDSEDKKPRHSAKVTAKVADKVIEAFKIINFPSDDPKNRTRFEGALKNGIPSGKGTMTWTSGGSYIGEWNNGMRHGYGVAKWPLKCKSDRYEGDWKEDKRWGFGTYVNKDGSSYAGQWVNDVRQGFGIFTYSEESPVERFEGYWKDGKQCGLGMYTWKDKSGYVGQLNNGQFEGFGVYTYEPDSVYKCYEGSWKNDKQNGTGTLYWKNGDKLIGHFIDDKLDGPGIKTSADGEIIQQGTWRNEVFLGTNEE